MSKKDTKKRDKAKKKLDRLLKRAEKDFKAKSKDHTYGTLPALPKVNEQPLITTRPWIELKHDPVIMTWYNRAVDKSKKSKSTKYCNDMVLKISNEFYQPTKEEIARTYETKPANEAQKLLPKLVRRLEMYGVIQMAWIQRRKEIETEREHAFSPQKRRNELIAQSREAQQKSRIRKDAERKAMKDKFVTSMVKTGTMSRAQAVRLWNKQEQVSKRENN